MVLTCSKAEPLGDVDQLPLPDGDEQQHQGRGHTQTTSKTDILHDIKNQSYFKFKNIFSYASVYICNMYIYSRPSSLMIWKRERNFYLWHVLGGTNFIYFDPIGYFFKSKRIFKLQMKWKLIHLPYFLSLSPGSGLVCRISGFAGISFGILIDLTGNCRQKKTLN